MCEKKRLIFIANLGIILLVFAVYIFNRHHSADTFDSILDIRRVAETNLQNGRVVHYLLYSGLSRLDINILEKQMLIQIILSTTLAFGVTSLTVVFYYLLEKQTIWGLVIIDLSILLVFISPNFLLGWYYYPETSLGASVSLGVTFLAIYFWCKKELRGINVLLSFIFCCVAVGMYQVYVEIYVGFCLAYSLLNHKFILN